MFEDGEWDYRRTEEQEQREETWLKEVRWAGGKLAIIECGAGTHITTVRYHNEMLTFEPGTTLIRINPFEPAVLPGHLSIQMNAREALIRINDRLHKLL
jgi:hypothetical protein